MAELRTGVPQPLTVTEKLEWAAYFTVKAWKEEQAHAQSQGPNRARSVKIRGGEQ